MLVSRSLENTVNTKTTHKICNSVLIFNHTFLSSSGGIYEQKEKCYNKGLTFTTNLLQYRHHLNNKSPTIKASPSQPVCYKKGLSFTTSLLQERPLLHNQSATRKASPSQPVCYKKGLTFTTNLLQ